MKKISTNTLVRPRKLLLNREAIAALTEPQLARVAGGVFGANDGGVVTYWPPCPQTEHSTTT